MENDEDLKIVLNVRHPKLIELLEQIKDNTGINYQNTIKFGLLLMFQDEIHKIKSFQAEQTRQTNQEVDKEEIKAQEQKIVPPSAPGLNTVVKEDAGGLLKVHITFVGKLRDAIETWKYRTGKSYQDIARNGLDKVFSFFSVRDTDNQKTETFVNENTSLISFLSKADTLTGFLND